MTTAESRSRRTLVIAANCGWNILNFRRPLVEALVADGWRVVALAGDDGSGPALAGLGAEFAAIRVDSSALSPVGDLRLMLDYLAELRRIRPQALLGFTVKPNIYGSLAACLLGIRVINNISGLGTAFMRQGPLSLLVGALYRLALRRSARVFFQNSEDMDQFVGQRLVRPEQAALLPGSGVDLDRFRPAAGTGRGDRRFRFLFVGRLLRDKGLEEYAEAARLLRPRWPDAEFAILGFAGSDNRSAVPLAEVERWQGEGLVHYLGEVQDVRPALGEADCVVLPSYREGLPRSLLEAAAMGRPMIATDVPGCRDVVSDGKDGFLCAPRSAPALAEAMEKMLRLAPAKRAAMGQKARRKVEQHFDARRVVDAYREALR